VIGVGGFYLYISSEVGDLEVQVEEGREKLARLRALAPKYQLRTAKTRRFRRLARANEGLDLQREVNRIAKGVLFEERNSVGEKMGNKLNLANALNYPGGKEKFLGPKPKRKGKKKNKDRVGYFRIDEPVRVGKNIPFGKLYQFLDRLEMTNKMLFVTDIEMRRLRRDGRLAQSGTAFTVSTYVYRGGEEEEAAETPAHGTPEPRKKRK
jgi:hypothetical protein